MNRYHVLVVDDDESNCRSLQKVLSAEGHDVQWFTDGPAALEALIDGPFHVLLTDVVMEPLTGLDLLAAISTHDLDTVPILMTGFGDVPSAVAAVQEGAFDYLQKPVDVERLCQQIKRAGQQARLRQENRELRARLHAGGALETMIGSSAVMQRLRVDIERAAKSDVTVLVTGESGSGKELVARALFEESMRSRGPFVVVNCAAVPGTLIESEFFGHERGAFTGAIKRHIGRFEKAHRGTLFLDEIGDIALDVQAKLLRVIEERTLERVGSESSLNVDVRLISATRYDLAERVEAGLFRQDLYFRLGVVHLHVPPLRDRRDDIPLLVNHFVHSLALCHNRRAPEVDAEVHAALRAFDWPGNVRELRNCVESLVVMAPGPKVEIADLPLQMRDTFVPTHDDGDNRSLADIEREAILHTLSRVGGNRAEAARRLGIGSRTLYRRLHQYGVLGDSNDEGSDVSN